MKMIDFVLKNKDVIQKLFSEESDGEFFIPADEFLFSSPDLEVEWDEMSLKFTLEIDPFKFTTALMPDEMKECSDALSTITDPVIRRQVVELMESTIKDAVEQEKDMATDNLAEAKASLEDAEKGLNSVLDTISEIKHAWGIP